MKKMICIVALCLASTFSFADESSVQKVLKSVHNKGLTECDEVIRKDIEILIGTDTNNYGTINHVETKVPFVNTEKVKISVIDEAIVYIDLPRTKWQEGGIAYSMYRKFGKQCLGTGFRAIRSTINQDCSQYLLHLGPFGEPKEVARTDDAIWMRPNGGDDTVLEEIFQRDGTKTVFTLVRGGGCKKIELF